MSKHLYIMSLNIEKVLDEKGISKAKLSELLGRKDNRSYATNLIKSPTLSSLEKIAQAIGVSVKDLFEDNENDNDYINLYTKDESGEYHFWGKVKKDI